LLKPCRIFSKNTFQWPTTKDALPVSQFIVVHRLGGEQGSPTAKQRSPIAGVMFTNKRVAGFDGVLVGDDKDFIRVERNGVAILPNKLLRFRRLYSRPILRGKELSHRRNRALSSTQNGETVQGPTTLRQYDQATVSTITGPLFLFRANSQNRTEPAVRAKSRNQ
jgi:hypothetical protein